MHLNFPRNSCSWAVTQAESFRNKSRMILNEWGTNLTNPSETICSIYKPDEGKVFIQADCAGAEALVVAYLCPPGNFRDLFIHGIKPHIFVAMHIFKEYWAELLGMDMLPYLKASVPMLKLLPRWKELSTAIKNDEIKYYIGKKSCHSFNYRQSSNSFIFVVLKESEGKVVISPQEGKRIKGIYDSLFPEIELKWHKEIDMILEKTKIMFNLFGHPREFYIHGPITDKHKREATAWVPQSTIGTLTNVAFVENQRYIEIHNLDWDLLNNKHDSILAQSPESQALLCARQLATSLEQTLISPRGEKFTMKSEVSIGKCWAHFDKLNPDKFPDGMKEIEL